LSCAGLICFSILPAAAQSDYPSAGMKGYLPLSSEREDAINSELDLVERDGAGTPSASVTQSVNKLEAATAVAAQTAPALKTAAAPQVAPSAVDETPAEKLRRAMAEDKKKRSSSSTNEPSAIGRERDKRVELGLQYATYHSENRKDVPYNYDHYYSEPNQVKRDGYTVGIFGSYTYRLWHNKPVHSFKDFLGENGLLNVLRAEGDISMGQMDYDSYATGKKTGFGITKLNARLLAGYDFPNDDESLVLTPYIGFGYRRFKDDGSGGWTYEWVHDYAEYGRLTQYYYIPIGADLKKRLNDNWDLGFRLEGDFLIHGTITDEYGDIDGVYTQTDVETGDPVSLRPGTTKHVLNRGLGFRTSCRLARKYEMFNLFFEPFFEYWHIDKSSEDPWFSEGVGEATAGDWYSVGRNDYEPSNYTAELGMRMGVQF